jgi:hypothetical protein
MANDLYPAQLHISKFVEALLNEVEPEYKVKVRELPL